MQQIRQIKNQTNDYLVKQKTELLVVLLGTLVGFYILVCFSFVAICIYFYKNDRYQGYTESEYRTNYHNQDNYTLA